MTAAARSSTAVQASPAPDGQSASAPIARPRRRPPRWYRSAWFDLVQFAALTGALLWLIVRGAQSTGYPWAWERVPRYVVRVIDGEVILGPLTKGLIVTLEIAASGMLLALLIGLATALLRLSSSLVGRAIAALYLEVIRNTPLLVQVLIFYFILGPVLGLSRLWAGILCLAFYEGTFAAEIIRSSIVSIARGQWEAGRSLGLTTFDLYRDVVLPQAVPLMIPPMTGVLVNLVKHSAIVSVIAVFDLTTQARTVAADTFMSFEIWLTTAAMYLTITLSLSGVAALLERRLTFVRR